MDRAARLLFPALRWTADRGFGGDRDLIETSLGLGVGGFCIFGGTVDDVRELTAELHRRSPHPLLVASDLERGAGQQFAGATALPPLAALGHLNDLDTTRRAAAVTAREALAVGVNWIFAPVADVDLEPANPIVGTRAFSTDAAHTAAHVAAWIEGAHAAGALCCAKHFPGHGRTTEDSHAALPRVTHDRAALQQDLQPFRAAVAAGADAMMTAHVVYDAFDPDHPATLSAPVLRDLLRTELGFTGMIVSDSLVMEGLQIATGGDERQAAAAALNAGCDALLYPGDVAGLAAYFRQDDNADVAPDRIADALARIDAAAQRARPAAAAAAAIHNVDAQWAEQLAERCCITVRGNPRAAPEIDLMIIDDDTGGPFAPPARDVFADALRACGIAVHDAGGEARPLVIAVYADVRAWKGTAALSESAATRIEEALASRADATVAYFGHPRITESMNARSILAAWGGEPLMQRAAARTLAR